MSTPDGSYRENYNDNDDHDGDFGRHTPDDPRVTIGKEDDGDDDEED